MHSFQPFSSSFVIFGGAKVLLYIFYFYFLSSFFRFILLSFRLRVVDLG